MPRLVCVPCRRQYKIVKTDNYVVEMFLEPPSPYRILNGDRWECPDCGHQIIAGFAELPVAEHFQEKFSDKLDRALNDDNTIYCYENQN